MKKIILIIFSVIFVLTIFPIVEAKNFNDLTSYQKQKYWVYIKECSPLLLNKEYNKYRICASAAFEKASQEKETNAWCTDSDSGKDFLTKGIVKTDIYPEGKEDYVKTFPSGATYLMEGFCSSKNQYAFAQKKCSDFGKKYYAKDGACVYENQSPVLTIAVNTTEINEGDYSEIYLYGSDADNDGLTFSAENLPEGAEINEVAPVPFPYDKEVAIFSWTPNYEQAGEYTINFSISDGEKDTSVTTTIIVQNINQPPVLDEIGDKTILEGEELSFSISATDPDGDALTFFAQNLPTGAVFENQIFKWTPNYEQAGEYNVNFYVSDGELNILENVLILVKPVNTLNGVISQDTILTLNDGKYLFTGNVLVEDNIKLTVEPGVIIDFNGYYLRNDGQLIIDGTPEQKILLNKAIIRFTDSTVDWDGGGGSVIRNSIFNTWSDSSVKKIIEINGASILIEENYISKYPGIAIYGDQYSNVIVKNNIIENGTGICIGGWDELAAISFWGSSSIIDNTIKNNPCDGIRINGVYKSETNNNIANNKIINNTVGVNCIGCNITLDGNNIIDNTQQGVYLSAEPNPSSINITNNIFSNNQDLNIYTSTLVFGYNLIVSENTLKKTKIYLQTQAVGWLGANILFSKNNIKDIDIDVPNPDISLIFVNNNIDGELKLSNTKGNISAVNNYWGTMDKTIIDSKIYDFYDDFELGKVIYEPFATEPFDIN